MENTIYHNLLINSSLDKVYEAISLPKHLINWWPLKCSGIPELNQEYNFNFTEEYDWYGVVAKVDKDESFHIKLTKADADWQPTTFGFELEKTTSAVRLRFSHRNWPECNNHFKYSSFCWALLLQGLKEYVETGKVISFEERS